MNMKQSGATLKSSKRPMPKDPRYLAKAMFGTTDKKIEDGGIVRHPEALGSHEGDHGYGYRVLTRERRGTVGFSPFSTRPYRWYVEWPHNRLGNNQEIGAVIAGLCSPVMPRPSTPPPPR